MGKAYGSKLGDVIGNMLGGPTGSFRGTHWDQQPLVPTLPRRKKLGLLGAWCSSSLVEQNLYIIYYIIYIFYIIQYCNWIILKKLFINLLFLHAIWKENGNDLPRPVHSRFNIINHLHVLLSIEDFLMVLRGQAHPWMIPFGMSHLDFLGSIELWTIIRNT